MLSSSKLAIPIKVCEGCSRERAIITMRFGLKDGQRRTYDEVGRVLGLTRERARLIEKRALSKLRKGDVR